MKLSIISVFVFSFLFFYTSSIAQNKTDLQAIALYKKAEASFNNASYDEALDYLKKAETLLGGTNSKLLYLKIQTLNLLAKIDPKKTTELQRSIAQFFQETDQNSYPADKYMNVVEIELDLKEQFKSEKKEDSTYLKIKGSNNLSDFENYFATFPNGKHADELKVKYDILNSEAQARAQKEINKATYLKDYNQYKKKGRRNTIAGTIFLAGGGALIGLGVKALKDYDEDLDRYDNWDYYLNGDNPYAEPWPSTFIMELSIGGALLVTGAILLPVGLSKFGHSREIKRKAKNEGINVAFYPLIDPIHQTYSAGFKMNF